MGDKQKKESRFTGYDWGLIVFLIIIMSSLIGLVAYGIKGIVKETNHQYVGKAELKKDISRVIKNGSNLNVVTIVYNNRVTETNRKLRNYSQELFYDNESLTLYTVMADLLSDYYLDSLPNKSDSVYSNQLVSLIEEFSRNNPFEELEPDQRVYFQNVQAKIPEQYDLVKEDLMRISKTLKEKNVLTEHYLQKSNLSFWISVAAFIISLLFGFIQIRQNKSNAINNADISNEILEKLTEKKE